MISSTRSLSNGLRNKNGCGRTRGGGICNGNNRDKSHSRGAVVPFVVVPTINNNGNGRDHDSDSNGNGNNIISGRGGALLRKTPD